MTGQPDERKPTPEDVEALAWLEGGDDGAPPGPPEDAVEALAWLEGGDDDPPSDPSEATGGGLDWIEDEDDSAQELPGTLRWLDAPNTSDDDKHATETAQDVFYALDCFGNSAVFPFDDAPEPIAEPFFPTPKPPMEDPKVQRALTTFARALVRERPPAHTRLDGIIRLTVGQILDPINAEILIVYGLRDDGTAALDDIFYSKTLFKQHPDLESSFHQGLDKLAAAQFDRGEGVVGKAIERRKSLNSLDARSDPDFKDLLGNATGYPVRTMLTVPIMDGEGVYGALQVMNKAPHCGEEFFSYQDLKLLELLAGLLGRLTHWIRDPELRRSGEELAGYYAIMAGTDVFDPTSDEVHWDDRLWKEVGEAHILRDEILPLAALDAKTLRVVLANPMDLPTRQNFEATTGRNLGEALIATPSQIRQVLTERLGLEPQPDPETEPETADELAEFTDRILQDAHARGVSDVHIEPHETSARVCYREDGALQECLRFPLQALPGVVARLKLMAGLDVAETRRPQDGTIQYERFNNRGLDFTLQVSTGPMAAGEKIIARIQA